MLLGDGRARDVDVRVYLAAFLGDDVVDDLLLRLRYESRWCYSGPLGRLLRWGSLYHERSVESQSPNGSGVEANRDLDVSDARRRREVERKLLELCNPGSPEADLPEDVPNDVSRESLDEDLLEVGNPLEAVEEPFSEEEVELNPQVLNDGVVAVDRQGGPAREMEIADDRVLGGDFVGECDFQIHGTAGPEGRSVLNPVLNHASIAAAIPCAAARLVGG